MREELLRLQKEQREKFETEPTQYRAGMLDCINSILSSLQFVVEDEPQGLDEAAKKYAWKKEEPLADGERLSCAFDPRIDAFKAGAEWMSEQGQTWICEIDRGRAVLDGVRLPFVLWDTYEDGDKVIVQIRKKNRNSGSSSKSRLNRT